MPPGLEPPVYGLFHEVATRQVHERATSAAFRESLLAHLEEPAPGITETARQEMFDLTVSAAAAAEWGLQAPYEMVIRVFCRIAAGERKIGSLPLGLNEPIGPLGPISAVLLRVAAMSFLLWIAVTAHSLIDRARGKRR